MSKLTPKLQQIVNKSKPIRLTFSLADVLMIASVLEQYNTEHPHVDSIWVACDKISTAIAEAIVAQAPDFASEV